MARRDPACASWVREPRRPSAVGRSSVERGRNTLFAAISATLKRHPTWYSVRLKAVRGVVRRDHYRRCVVCIKCQGWSVGLSLRSTVNDSVTKSKFDNFVRLRESSGGRDQTGHDVMAPANTRSWRANATWARDRPQALRATSAAKCGVKKKPPNRSFMRAGRRPWVREYRVVQWTTQPKGGSFWSPRP